MMSKILRAEALDKQLKDAEQKIKFFEMLRTKYEYELAKHK